MEAFKRLPVTFLTLIISTNLLHLGDCIRCYECVSRLAPGQTDSCLYGDELNLKRVTCLGPSVCATYHYQTVVAGYTTMNHITRGCQALRWGSTCEDIFHQLRERNQILPGQHTCTTCSTDYCNSSSHFVQSFSIMGLTILLHLCLNAF